MTPHQFEICFLLRVVEHAAVHESGHAMAAIRLGIPVHRPMVHAAPCAVAVSARIARWRLGRAPLERRFCLVHALLGPHLAGKDADASVLGGALLGGKDADVAAQVSHRLRTVGSVSAAAERQRERWVCRVGA